MRPKVLVGTSLGVLLGAAVAWAQPAPAPGPTQPGKGLDEAYPDEPPTAPDAGAPAPSTAAAPPAEATAPSAELGGATTAGASANTEPALGLPPVPPPMPKLFATDEEQEETTLVGFSDGRLFIRDPDDMVRIFPGGRLYTDFYSTFGPGVGDVSVADSGGALDPQLTLRRVRLELSGELFEQLGFTLGFELGGERIGDVPLGSTRSRFAPSMATTGRILPAVVSVSYRYKPWLGVTVGQFHVPFSMENRTDESNLSSFERSLGIRGFAVPYDKDLGLALWGELEQRLLGYEVGVFTGDGQDRPNVDAWPDVVGRVYSRPLATSGEGSFFKLAQIGVSARYGARDPAHVTYDYPSITTGQGFVLWQPGYRDSYGRFNRVLPSGEGYAAGGELRLPFDLPGGRAIDVRGEAYWVHNDTREAIEGYELTNTERFGRMQGGGWTATVSVWHWGDSFVSGEPGIMRPPTIDLVAARPLLRGLELYLLGSGIAANYSGATREDSQPDANTPSANIAIYQLGGGAQYWYGTNLRVGLQYLLYYAPDSGDPRRNQAVVASNVSAGRDGTQGGANVQHELSGRIAVSF